MEVVVRGNHREVSPALKATATEKVSKLERYLDGLDHAEIHLFEERNPRITEREVCEITLSGRGHTIRAKASAVDTQTALEKVLAKLEHQIERAKRRRTRKGRKGSSGPPTTDGDQSDDQEDAGEPRIVKSKLFDIKPMTPEEAVLQMELVAHDFFFFTNADTSRAAVVYRRDDGQFGLIDAE